MKLVRFAAITMVALTLLVACAPAAVPTLAPAPAPTTAPAPAPTTAPITAPIPQTGSSAPMSIALTVAKTSLGNILADGDGKILYMYTKDTKDTSACYDACATNWPPLFAEKVDAKDGVDAKLIGSTKRTDGKMQVTYNGMPLYYWVKDQKPGDTTGQNVGGVWFVVAPDGKIIKPATLTLAKTNLGSILADSDGKVLYMYTKDTKDTSACYDACATNWPPLLADKIDAKDGVDAKLIGYAKRTDGKMQVTYNGMPLYYWVKDQKPGDTTGQNVGGVWFVIAPDGKIIKPATLTLTKTNLGSILADGDGKVLYMYTKDTKDTSACYNACATNWPPLLADKIDAKDGVDAKLIGYTKRTDGNMQVTYNGMPLYYWVKDQKPGDVTGQAVGGVWWVLQADGAPIMATSSASNVKPAAVAPASPMNNVPPSNTKGYGY
jgi:predicted lipoprotein with Yx(FWY)xxD motif